LARGPRERLIGLLDYVEQVVRLDESVAFRVSDYRLADGTSFAIRPSDTANLPGIQLDMQEEEGPVWLAVARLPRREPPTPPPEIAEWILTSADPARLPEARLRRPTNGLVVERAGTLTHADARSEQMIAVARRREELREVNVYLEGQPATASAIQSWITGPWATWATEEMPRRRTIALYQQLYKIFQMVDSGVADSPIEVIWGIGVVRWRKEGRVVDRPLLEIRVDLELDEARGEVSCSGEPIGLRLSERRLLAVLMRRSGRIVLKSTLEDALSEIGRELSANAVEVLVSRVRRLWVSDPPASPSRPYAAQAIGCG